MIKVTIDGQELELEPGLSIIEAADKFNIHIPRFCYHPHLSIAASCRMCLVEVENNPKLQPACNTLLNSGMKINTLSARVKANQAEVLEFLLINHPLDCPVCDQAGECELQDLSIKHAKSRSAYTEAKRIPVDPNLGPLIATEMTRCIHCTRCVRFTREISAFPELGGLNKSADLEISNCLEQSLASNLSGNIIDLCPVGALTSKLARFQTRAWQLRQSPGLGLHDGLGSNLYWHTQDNRVVRVVARTNPEINQIWLSDQDRFSYEALEHPERLEQALVKLNGKWQELELNAALELAHAKLSAIPGDELAGFISPNVSMEEGLYFQQYLRALGSEHIDAQLQALDPLLTKQEFLGFDFKFLEQAKTIVILGANIEANWPILIIKLQAALQKGARVFMLNPELYQAPAGFNYQILETDFEAYLAELLLSLELKQSQDPKIAALLEALSVNSMFILGDLVLNHPRATAILDLLKQISSLTQAKLTALHFGANARGLAELACRPGKHGYAVQEALAKNLSAYVLYGIEPEHDLGRHSLLALAQAKFNLAFSAFACPSLLASVDLILPLNILAQTQGSFMNLSGSIQVLPQPVIKTKIPANQANLRLLLQLQGLKPLELAAAQELPLKFSLTKTNLKPLKTRFLLAKARKTDYILRRASALASRQPKLAVIYMHPDRLANLGLQQVELAGQNFSLEPSLLPYDLILLPEGFGFINYLDPKLWDEI